MSDDERYNLVCRTADSVNQFINREWKRNPKHESKEFYLDIFQEVVELIKIKSPGELTVKRPVGRPRGSGPKQQGNVAMQQLNQEAELPFDPMFDDEPEEES